MVAFMLMLAAQARAQATDPLEGRVADIQDTGGAADIPNRIVISVTDCEAEQGAPPEIEVADEDSTPNENFIDGVGDIQIDFQDDQIIISAGGEDLQVGGNPARLTPGPGEVVSSSGITCSAAEEEGGTSTSETEPEETSTAAASAGEVNLTCEQLIKLVEDGNAGQGQYGGRDALVVELTQRCEGSANVIAGTVPGKLLADTGGPLPGLLMLGLLLTGGGLLLRSSLRRE